MRMFRKVLLTFGLLLMAEMVAFAQGTMKGTITDKKTNEPMPFVNVIVKQDGKQVHGGTTDFDGVFTIKPLAVGTYDIEVSSVGYNRYQRTGIQVKASGFTVVDIQLTSSATNLDVIEIEADRVPIIEVGSPESGQRMSAEDIQHMPGNSVDAIVAAVGGMGFNDFRLSLAVPRRVSVKLSAVHRLLPSSHLPANSKVWSVGKGIWITVCSTHWSFT